MKIINAFKKLISTLAKHSQSFLQSNVNTTSRTTTQSTVVAQDGINLLMIKGNLSTTVPTVTQKSPNLLEFAVGESVNSGVTVTRMSDGTIILNGTSTAANVFGFNYPSDIDQEKMYTLMDRSPDWKPGSQAGVYIYLYCQDSSGTSIGHEHLITNTSCSQTAKPAVGTARFQVGIWWHKGYTFNNHVIKPMLVCESLVNLPYYTNAATINGITYTVNPDSSITASGTQVNGAANFYLKQNELPIIKGHTYRIGKSISGTVSEHYPAVMLRNPARTFVILQADGTDEVLYTAEETENVTLAFYMPSASVGSTINCTAHIYMYDETLGFGNRTFYKGGTRTLGQTGTYQVTSDRRVTWWIADVNRGDVLSYTLPPATSAYQYTGSTSCHLGLNDASRVLATQYDDKHDITSTTKTYTVSNADTSAVAFLYSSWTAGSSTETGKKNNVAITQVNVDESSNYRHKGIFFENAKQGDIFSFINASTSASYQSFGVTYFEISSKPEKWYWVVTKSTSGTPAQIYVEEVIKGVVTKTRVFGHNEVWDGHDAIFGDLIVRYNRSTTNWEIESTKKWSISSTGSLNSPGIALNFKYNRALLY